MMKVLRVLLVAVAAFGSALAGAQEFPSGTVRLVVPYPAGGGVDGMARPIAERLTKLWQKPVVIDNKAGGSTIIGSDAVAKSVPDGLTLLFTSDSSITSNPHLFASMPFDPIKDLVPVTQLIDLHQMVVVHPSVTANTLQELVSQAKARPNQFNYGSYGAGSQPNLLFESLRVQTGAQIAHIPYKGIAPALAATLAGEVQMTLGGAATTSGHMASGRMKALAIGRAQRLPQHPNVPTLREAGYPDVDPRSWFGIFAPRGTPRAIVEKIRNDVVRVITEPEFDAREITGKGYTAVGSTPDEFAAFVKADLEYKGKMIKSAGIKAE
ncbi:MAG TPA: tripartite tricarboxylate transporter substrate binding protein [Casimicrobiaceae bacterium]|nr:tripartite tricarboxylate transporter substrate binding protein [Casimicrobiaceae bacterium]